MSSGKFQNNQAAAINPGGGNFQNLQNKELKEAPKYLNKEKIIGISQELPSYQVLTGNPQNNLQLQPNNPLNVQNAQLQVNPVVITAPLIGNFNYQGHPLLGKTIELCENPEEILKQAISVFVLERIEITDLMRIRRNLPERYDVIAVTESGQFFHLFEAYRKSCDNGMCNTHLSDVNFFHTGKNNIKSSYGAMSMYSKFMLRLVLCTCLFCCCIYCAKTDRVEVKLQNYKGEYTYKVWSKALDFEYRESDGLKWRIKGDVPRDFRNANIGQYNIDVLKIDTETKKEIVSGNIVRHFIGIVDLASNSTILECKFPVNSSVDEKFSLISGTVLIDLQHFGYNKPHRPGESEGILC